MADVTLPTLAKSASAATLGAFSGSAPPASPVAAEAMVRAASQAALKKLGSSELPRINGPGWVSVRFSPGDTGMYVSGMLVTWSSGDAWMKGVRAGWKIRVVDSQPVIEEDGAEYVLQKAAEGEAKYVIRFEKAHSKFGMGASVVDDDLLKEQIKLRLRRAFPFQGRIERAEHRGITYKQMERAVAFAEEECSAWKDTAPKNSKLAGQKLSMSFLTLQHVNAWMILPATEKQKCSFVELLTKQRQPPTWFVCHWWGDRVLDFMTCLMAHILTRRCTTDTNYWVAAYANRPHTFDFDISEDPTSTTCFKAIQAARFRVLMVLDVQGSAFSRIWCAFEQTMCLDRSDAPLDFSVCRNSKAQVLTHGLTQEEEDLETQHPGQGVRAKFAREADFPIEVLETGMQQELQKGEASQEEDRTRILNCLRGAPLDDVPAKDDPKYAETNMRLHSLLALATWVKVTGSKEATRAQCADFSSAIQADEWRSSLDMRLEGLSSEGMRLLAQGLPPNLEDIKLRLRGASISDKDLLALAENLPAQLKKISMDLRNCKEVSEGLPDAFTSRTKRPVIIDFDLLGTEARKFVQDCENPKKDMALAFGVNLCRRPSQTLQYQHQTVPAVPALTKALWAPRPEARCAAARALASFGEKALQALPELQRVLAEDTEVSVQKAAAAAIAKINGKEPAAA